MGVVVGFLVAFIVRLLMDAHAQTNPTESPPSTTDSLFPDPNQWNEDYQDLEQITSYCLSCSNQTNEYVCGSDGTTYQNPCKLICASLQLQANNETGIGVFCAADCQYCNNYRCSCSNDRYLPVCATDGLTYANPCSLNCENERRYESGNDAYALFNCYGRCSCIIN